MPHDVALMRLVGRWEEHLKNDEAEDKQDADPGDNPPFQSRHHASLLPSGLDDDPPCLRPVSRLEHTPSYEEVYEGAIPCLTNFASPVRVVRSSVPLPSIRI